jgi:Tfp pilus assembly protein PilX
MKQDRLLFPTVGNQRGMALISALLLLMIVSLMAVGMSTDTSMDVRIAGYEKFKAVSFGNAEAALNTGSEVLEDNIYEAGWTLPTAYPNLSALYTGNIAIVNNGSFYMDSNFAGNEVMGMTGDIEAEVVVQRLLSKLAEGGATQMAAGYEMLGKGAAGGGIHIFYNFEAEGTGADQALTKLGMHYRHSTN